MSPCYACLRKSNAFKQTLHFLLGQPTDRKTGFWHLSYISHYRKWQLYSILLKTSPVLVSGVWVQVMFNPSLPVIYYWVKPALFQPLLASSESLKKKTSFYLLETNQSDHLSEHCPQALRGPMGSMRLEGPSTSGSFCAQAWCSWTLSQLLSWFILVISPAQLLPLQA